MFKDFKEFVMRGNVLDLAVGIILGAAFGKIVATFVNNILMPPLGLLLGKIDFANLLISLNGQSYSSLKAAQDAGAPVIAYGMLINDVINFLIVALVVFLLVRWFNSMKKPAAAPSTKVCPFCDSVISLKATRCPECTSEL